MTTAKPNPSALDLSGITWRTSSYSGGGGDCVRIGATNGFVLISDSKNPELPPQVYTPAEMRTFLSGIRTGAFDATP
ncbi:DUF397 domain-containing protein [Streptomyces specialis]|uniref:DUF397 domain-containing protein n=1 Tax=Streptomyces specialis TaxID=498367 RepID=UPI00073EA0BE|nr:DUF397 domain-containing protein [Streptomyces specialis]